MEFEIKINLSDIVDIMDALGESHPLYPKYAMAYKSLTGRERRTETNNCNNLHGPTKAHEPSDRVRFYRCPGTGCPFIHLCRMYEPWGLMEVKYRDDHNKCSNFVDNGII